MNTITRKTARTGTQVCVSFRNGRPELTGTLVGWGTQLIVVAPSTASVEWPWKRHSVSHIGTTVTAI